MGNEQLHEFLEQLHFELIRLKSDDESQRQKINSLRMHISELLDSPNPGGYPPTFQKALEDSVTSLEISYPQVTGLIDKILRLLSSIGI